MLFSTLPIVNVRFDKVAPFFALMPETLTLTVEWFLMIFLLSLVIATVLVLVSLYDSVPMVGTESLIDTLLLIFSLVPTLLEPL